MGILHRPIPGEQQRVVQLLVKEFRVSTDGLLIRLRTNGLRCIVAELEDGQKRSAEPKPQRGSRVVGQTKPFSTRSR